ncbi:MAG: DEAD/DEAH box helicase [candidate division KSB1 bacterium]|nr:DEAD/DEAH box helicase [candidate division KSB1 bacterium]
MGERAGNPLGKTRGLGAVLEALRADALFMDNVTAWKVLPARPAITRPFPSWMDSRLREALVARGIRELYSHQSESVELIRSGKNVVVVTPTASGKTLCYNLPVLQTVLEDPDSRALYLFPTKALSQDQVEELHGLVEALGEDIKTYTFDGDTPESARRVIRASGHIVVTNPDMLHQGILPHHTRWIKLFENLRYVVIDELHQYRGVFGSHMANLLRRLKRICRHYGSRPQFIFCSATIANPRELAERLLEEPVELVDKNGAPSGEKHFILYNPPVINRQLGLRKSVVHEATRIAERFLAAEVQTIVFARSRLRVEILLSYLRESARKHHIPEHRLQGYRGGYLPLERRKIERGLRTGEVLGVVSTNALELGIDIGQLEACVMTGYPGTVASTWQQAGRAGRRQGVSVAILVASSNPTDQYMVTHPDYFFERPPEAGTLDPNNLVVLMSHVKCAAFELPFHEDEVFGVESTPEILEYLREHHVLHLREGKYYWTSDVYPAEEVSLRTASPENVVIVDASSGNQVIGEVDLFSAPLLVHEEAIYLHGGRQYHVDKLDWERRKAYVHEVEVDYYTDAELKTDIGVLETFEERPAGKDSRALGEVRVTTLPTMYKKIRFHTHENVGWGRIHLPEMEMHTTAYWWQLSPETEMQLKAEGLNPGEGLKGLAYALNHVAPIFVMCDPSDLRSVPMLRAPHTGKPTIFIYDNYPGGVGLSEKLFHLHEQLVQATLDLIRNCPCVDGCPSCVGPPTEAGTGAKAAAIAFLARSCPQSPSDPG